MMATRTARTNWTGTLMEGSGQTELSSSKAAKLDVSFPRRTADEAEGVTSPEELIGGAHSSCFAMQMSGEIAGAGGTPKRLDVTADVKLGTDNEAGGLKVTGIALTVRGEVEGLDAEGFVKAAEAAKVNCPISKALAAVDITLDAALD